MVALSTTSNTATTLEGQPSSRSFFSRLALPIRSRSTRNVVDFHIRPAEPYRKYKAGDSVKGAVFLALVKPIRLTHLTVALRGFVRVYKNPTAANEVVSPHECQVSDGLSHFRYLGNGYASLFQDEQVLSGEGRLEPGRYEFNFDLLFPEKTLPSSIEFERGAIGYTILATLTRPSSMNATTNCDRKVEFVEKVDVGFLPTPRPRTIYLEPISRRSKKKRSTTSEKANSVTAAEVAGESFDFDSTRLVETSTEGSLITDEASQDAHQTPRSPVHSDLRSEISGESAVSGSTGFSLRDRIDPNQAGNPVVVTAPAGGAKRCVSEDKTVTTTIELIKSGCLPGDTIPVKVDVQHTKRIKSMYGVIVTLYRQGRVDSAPPAALFENISKDEQRRLEKEEYYPKSKTGLGGLSLSSAGTCSVFRKDLSQAFSPLIIDPATLNASVTTCVRVPENSFPSIKGVPGEMISFKYRLEVIVDLGGKLANAIHVGQNSRLSTAGGVSASSGRDKTGLVASSCDGSLVNTDALKREKGVIFDSFEVVVGTTDSSRRGGQIVRTKDAHADADVMDNEIGQGHGAWEDEGYDDAGDACSQEYVPHPGDPDDPTTTGYAYWNQRTPQQQQQTLDPVPLYIPPPDLPDESSLSEKERIRLAEQKLLPSQPDLPSPTARPSAPVILDEEVERAGEAGPSVPAAPSGPASSTTPSAPTVDDLALARPVPNPASSTDDKQELERQRLMAEASAPPELPEFPEDYEAGVRNDTGPGAAPTDAGASAPILTDNDHDAYGPRNPQNGAAGSSGYAHVADMEPLPAYER